MSLPSQLATQFRQLQSGGNWTGVNLQQTLEGITWERAITKVYSFNSIAVLVYHIDYYVSAVLNVLHGNALDASDKFSFDCPPVQSEEDWKKLVEKAKANADQFALLVEQLPESRLWEDFSGNKYGNYYRNITGVIEHTHYHLGQIVLIKKLLLQS